MQISILLLKQIVQLFLMILMGYIMVKIKFLKEEDSKVISKIILYLIVPSVIITAFQVDYTPSIMKGLAVACIASVILQFLLLFVTWIMGKIFHLNMVEYTSAYYSNSGNLIVPLVTYILGKEWVIYGCVFMSVQLFFIWTHCKCKISGETEISLKKILLNINMISVFAGVFLFFTKIRFPEIIGNTLSSVGSMIGPLSMIVTGMLIAGVDLKKVFTNKRIYLVTFIRLVIEPIIALAVIILLGMKNWHPQAENIILITYMAAITPCASTITQMCQVYGNDSKYASAINVMTTLLAVVTMPLENSTISGVLERMEKKELIERQVSKEDRRFIEVVLTEKGKALQNPILATVEEVNKDVLSEMSQEEQSELKKALRILGGLEDE